MVIFPSYNHLKFFPEWKIKPKNDGKKFEKQNLKKCLEFFFSEFEREIRGEIQWAAPVFEKWEGAQVSNIRPELSVSSCESFFETGVPKPELSPDGKTFSFNPQFVEHQCFFRFKINANLRIFDPESQEFCQTRYEMPDSESLTFLANCQTIPGFPCKNPETAQNNQNCFDCAPPKINREAVLAWNETRNQYERKVRISWEFPSQRDGRPVREYCTNSKLSASHIFSHCGGEGENGYG